MTVPRDPSPTQPTNSYPNPGDVLRRLRELRGWSLGDVATLSGLSTSFLSSLERGESDIALGRLARLAAVFDHDVGSFLGFSARKSTPRFVQPDERVVVDRGPGIRYEVLRLAGTGMEVVLTELAPGAQFSHEFQHEGMDITLVTAGRIVATYDGRQYPLTRGDCVMWSGGYPHSFANTSDAPAQYVGIVTAPIF